MNMIGYALSMAKRFYDKDTYDHALRVATYIAENPMIDDENMEDCIALGIMHDLWEDTDYPVVPVSIISISFNAWNCLQNRKIWNMRII